MKFIFTLYYVSLKITRLFNVGLSVYTMTFHCNAFRLLLIIECIFQLKQNVVCFYRFHFHLNFYFCTELVNCNGLFIRCKLTRVFIHNKFAAPCSSYCLCSIIQHERRDKRLVNSHKKAHISISCRVVVYVLLEPYDDIALLFFSYWNLLEKTIKNYWFIWIKVFRKVSIDLIQNKCASSFTTIPPSW